MGRNGSYSIVVGAIGVLPRAGVQPRGSRGDGWRVPLLVSLPTLTGQRKLVLGAVEESVCCCFDLGSAPELPLSVA